VCAKAPKRHTQLSTSVAIETLGVSKRLLILIPDSRGRRKPCCVEAVAAYPHIVIPVIDVRALSEAHIYEKFTCEPSNLEAAAATFCLKPFAVGTALEILSTFKRLCE
jgi:hypothetical protein